MAGPKSIQTRFVEINTSTIHPYACFLRGAKTARIRCLPYASQEHLTNKLGA